MSGTSEDENRSFMVAKALVDELNNTSSLIDAVHHLNEKQKSASDFFSSPQVRSISDLLELIDEPTVKSVSEMTNAVRRKVIESVNDISDSEKVDIVKRLISKFVGPDMSELLVAILKTLKPEQFKQIFQNNEDIFNLPLDVIFPLDASIRSMFWNQSDDRAFSDFIYIFTSTSLSLPPDPYDLDACSSYTAPSNENFREMLNKYYYGSSYSDKTQSSIIESVLCSSKLYAVVCCALQHLWERTHDPYYSYFRVLLYLRTRTSKDPTYRPPSDPFGDLIKTLHTAMMEGLSFADTLRVVSSFQQLSVDDVNRLVTDVVNGLKKQQNPQKKPKFEMFHTPVVQQLPAISAQYLRVISHPMDFSVMLSKAARKEYTSLAAAKEDIDLIRSNCVRFNPNDKTFHAIADSLVSSYSQAIALETKHLLEPSSSSSNVSSSSGSTKTRSLPSPSFVVQISMILSDPIVLRCATQRAVHDGVLFGARHGQRPSKNPFVLSSLGILALAELTQSNFPKKNIADAFSLPHTSNPAVPAGVAVPIHKAWWVESIFTDVGIAEIHRTMLSTATTILKIIDKPSTDQPADDGIVRFFPMPLSAYMMAARNVSLALLSAAKRFQASTVNTLKSQELANSKKAKELPPLDACALASVPSDELVLSAKRTYDTFSSWNAMSVGGVLITVATITATIRSLLQAPVTVTSSGSNNGNPSGSSNPSIPVNTTRGNIAAGSSARCFSLNTPVQIRADTIKSIIIGLWNEVIKPALILDVEELGDQMSDIQSKDYKPLWDESESESTKPSSITPRPIFKLKASAPTSVEVSSSTGNAKSSQKMKFSSPIQVLMTLNSLILFLFQAAALEQHRNELIVIQKSTQTKAGVKRQASRLSLSTPNVVPGTPTEDSTPKTPVILHGVIHDDRKPLRFVAIEVFNSIYLPLLLSIRGNSGLISYAHLSVIEYTRTLYSLAVFSQQDIQNVLIATFTTFSTHPQVLNIDGLNSINQTEASVVSDTLLERIGKSSPLYDPLINLKKTNFFSEIALIWQQVWFNSAKFGWKSLIAETIGNNFDWTVLGFTERVIRSKTSRVSKQPGSAPGSAYSPLHPDVNVSPAVVSPMYMGANYNYQAMSAKYTVSNSP